MIKNIRWASILILLCVLSLVAAETDGQTGWSWYKTDPHVHSVVSAEAMVDLGIISYNAQLHGYDALFLTDHNGGSSFQINNLTANYMVFEDSYTRWTIGTYGSLSSTTNSLASNPVNSGSQTLRLRSSSNQYGETFVWTKRGPNLRSGDILLTFSVYPTRIDAGSGAYVSVALGGDATVEKDVNGYTTGDGVVSPGKSTVLVWQLGTPRAAASDPNARVITHSLSYQLNQWNHYSINISQALQAIPAADRPLDYNGLVHLKMAVAGNGGTAEAYFDTYTIQASNPTAPANEFVTRTGFVDDFDTASFRIFPSYEMGQRAHTQRFNFGITDPAEYRSYTFGTDGIPETQQLGYPAQVNHPGVTITTQEVIDTQAHGADFVEVKEQDWIDTWDALMQQGVVILGQWSSDTHNSSFEGRPATYLYAEALTFDALVRSMYEGRSYNGDSNFLGRIILNLDSGSQVPYPARYPVYVSDGANSANVHLLISGDMSSNYAVEWMRNGSLLASESTNNASYEATKAISLSGAQTYVRAQVRRGSDSYKGLSQAIVFIDVPSLPSTMRYHVDRVVTPNNRDYTRIATRGIVDTSWNDVSDVLWLRLDNPVNSLASVVVKTDSAPQRVRVDNVIITKASSLAGYNTATNTTWYYDASTQQVWVKVRHTSQTAGVSVEFGLTGDTLPPSVPQNLSASAINLGQINLSWNASSDNTSVSGYTIYRDGSPLVTVSGDKTTYSDKMVQPGTSYSYTVDAFDPFGNRSAKSTAATATTPVTSTFIFTVDEDAFVDASNPSTNYGSSTQVRADATPLIRSYLRFNLSSFAWYIQSAKLEVYANNSSSIGYNVRGTSGVWNENSITSTNSPAYGSIVGSSGTYSSNAWTSVDVTSLVTGAGQINLVMTTTSDSALSFSSREGSQPARLVIVASKPPPGSTPTNTPTATLTPTVTLSPTMTNTPTVTPTLAPISNITVPAAADSYVHSQSSSTNYGSSTALRTDASPEIRSYLRFDVPTLNGRVVNADLRIYSSTSSSLGYTLYTTGSNWSESGITYNNAPAVGASIGASGTIKANTWTIVDVTSLVTGGGSYNLVITSTDNTAVRYSSREDTNGPELLLVVENQPGATSTPSNTPTVTFTPTKSPTPSVTFTPSNTPTATQTLAVTNTATATLTPTNTPTATLTSTYTFTPNTATMTPSLTPTATSTSPQSITLVPVADSYVTEIDANTNFGSNAALRTDGTPLIYSYLRFTVPTLSGGVTNASLRVFAETTSNLGFDVRATSGGWGESTITYTNAPAFGGIIGSSGLGSAGTWLTVNVTSLVTGPGEVNLVMTTSDPTAVRYSSRQGMNPPQLVITLGSTLQSMSNTQSQPITVLQPTNTPLPTAIATYIPSPTPSPMPTLTATSTVTPETIAPEETPLVIP